MATQITRKKPLIKPLYPADYRLEWGEDVPESVLTHMVRLCDLLASYVDQDAISVGKLAHRIVHHPDTQAAVLALTFELKQSDAAGLRNRLIGKRKLEECSN